MTDLNVFYILLILFIIVMSIDITTESVTTCMNNNPCRVNEVVMTLLIHHALDIFLYFGWLFSNKWILRVYLMIPVALCIHWITNDGKCWLSQMYNSQCGLEDGLQSFNGFFKMFNMRTNVFCHDKYCNQSIIVTFGICVAIYKLCRR